MGGGKKELRKRKHSSVPPKKQGDPKKRSRFLCKVRYQTSLPEPHAHMKMLRYPHPEDRLTRYCASYLDLKREFDVYPEQFLGVPIDLVNVDQYREAAERMDEGDEDGSVRQAPMHPEDAILFEPEPADDEDEEKLPVGWLRKSMFLSNNWYGKTSKHVSKAALEEKAQEMARQKRRERREKSTREYQIKAIVSSFEKANAQPKHPSKPHLKPVDVVPFLPIPSPQKPFSYSWIQFSEPEMEEIVQTEKSLILSLSQDHQALYERDPEDHNVENKLEDGFNFKWKREFTRSGGTGASNDNFFIMLKPGAAEFYRFLKKKISLSYHVSLLQRFSFCRFQRKVLLGPRGGASGLAEELEYRPTQIKLKPS